MNVSISDEFHFVIQRRTHDLDLTALKPIPLITLYLEKTQSGQSLTFFFFIIYKEKQTMLFSFFSLQRIFGKIGSLCFYFSLRVGGLQ